MRVGVLASGRGSNLTALLEDAARTDSPYSIAVVVSNRAGARALKRARAAGVPALLVERAAFDSRAAHQQAILDALREYKVEIIVCAGFDQILGAEIIAAFPNRILNIHPSLLPAFAGTLRAQAEALAYGVKVTGCTVHLVTADVDGGPIVAQAAVLVHAGDTVESLSARILEQEHCLLPSAVRALASGRLCVEGRRAYLTAPLAVRDTCR